MVEFLVELIPSKENIADLMTKCSMSKRGDCCLEIFFVINMITIKYQFYLEKMQSGKLNQIGNIIKLEATRKMCP